MTIEEANQAHQWFEKRTASVTMPGARRMFLLATEALREQVVDPIHAAGGCYCRECKYCKPHPTSDQCKICTNKRRCDEFHPLVSDNDFCSYGRRRETTNG